MKKECNKCSELKPLTEFHKDSKAKDGHNNTCKLCRKAKRDEPTQYTLTPPELVTQMEELYTGGKSLTDIASITGVSVSTVGRRLGLYKSKNKPTRRPIISQPKPKYKISIHESINTLLSLVILALLIGA